MQEETKKTSKKQNTSLPYRVYVFAVVGLAVATGLGYFGWTKYQSVYNSPEAIQAKAQAKAEQDKQEYLEALAKVMIVPEGESVMFVVNDAQQMRTQQAFFKDTNNGDVLLVFQTAQKAVLFRPETNVIINAGPINFENTQPAQAATRN